MPSRRSPEAILRTSLAEVGFYGLAEDLDRVSPSRTYRPNRCQVRSSDLRGVRALRRDEHQVVECGEHRHEPQVGQPLGRAGQPGDLLPNVPAARRARPCGAPVSSCRICVGRLRRSTTSSRPFWAAHRNGRTCSHCARLPLDKPAREPFNSPRDISEEDRSHRIGVRSRLSDTASLCRQHRRRWLPLNYGFSIPCMPEDQNRTDPSGAAHRHSPLQA
jgi:hypothetical protein